MTCFYVLHIPDLLVVRYIFVGDFQCQIRHSSSMLIFATVTVSQAAKFFLTSCSSLMLKTMFVEYGMQEDGFNTQRGLCFLH